MLRPPLPPERGFTLVELTVVVALIAIATTLGIRILSAQLEASAVASTRAKQQAIRDAVMNYFAKNQRLPCPDTEPGAGATGGWGGFTAASPPDGVENREAGLPEACPAYANGPPSVAPDTLASSGVVPFATLGLPRDVALDAWGNYFNYVVANGPAGSRWQQSNTVTDRSIGSIRIADRDAGGNLIVLSDQAVVAIISRGPNALGAVTASGSIQNLPAAGTDEFTNHLPSGVPAPPPLVWARRSTDVAGAGGTFDDIVTYISANELTEPLVRIGAMQSSDAAARQLVSQARSAVLGDLHRTVNALAAAGFCNIQTDPAALGLVPDPWNRPIVINAAGVAPVPGRITTASTGMVTITSAGANVGIATDDIVLALPVSEILGILAQSAPANLKWCS